jgi:hypothetical protein
MQKRRTYVLFLHIVQKKHNYYAQNKTYYNARTDIYHIQCHLCTTKKYFRTTWWILYNYVGDSDDQLGEISNPCDRDAEREWRNSSLLEQLVGIRQSDWR